MGISHQLTAKNEIRITLTIDVLVAQARAVAHIVYLKAPHVVRSLRSIWSPLIPPIKAFRPNVAFEYPENSLSKSQIEEPSTRRRHKCNANTSPPVVGRYRNVSKAEKVVCRALIGKT
jgi:hypothetical protein